MADLNDGETIEMQGSGSKPYVLKNVGGVYSCSCPAWRNQSLAIEQRTCKHLRKLRGDEAEDARVGSAEPGSASRAAAEKDTNAPPLLLAQTWEFSDPTGWWLSEKLDGVRAFWDGKQFFSRLGNVFHAPDWFTAGLPNVALDGELWLDRKKFQRTVSIVRRQDKSDLWKELTYIVFDTPTLDKAFEARLDFVRDCLADRKCGYARPHEHLECHGIEHLKSELSRLENLGGEGLMLRKPKSRYEAGRSTTLLKVKSFHDAEARVVKHVPGAGRHKGRLGALMVEMPDGTTFSVGTGFTDKEREHPPEVGSVITYRYQELSDGGVPRFPSFVGLREDSPGTGKLAATAKVSEKAAPEKIRVEAKPQPAQAAPGPAAGARRFELSDDKSSKFWEITIADTDVTVRFGRLGTNGQTQTKSFADAAAAARHADKLIDEKLEKGYEEAT